MKRPFFQLFNVMMACVVLLSSTGFGLVEHSCQMRGKKKTMVLAFSNAKNQQNCSDKMPTGSSKQTTVKKTECCQDDQHYENVDVSSSLSQLVAKFVKIVAETVLTGVSVLVAWLINWIFDEESSLVSLSVPPPSPSGRDIITSAHRLLI